jgi:hypothetical protein
VLVHPGHARDGAVRAVSGHAMDWSVDSRPGAGCGSRRRRELAAHASAAHSASNQTRRQTGGVGSGQGHERARVDARLRSSVALVFVRQLVPRATAVMKPQRVRSIVAAVMAVISVALGGAAISQDTWFTCGGKVLRLSLGLSSWSITDAVGVNPSGSNCEQPGLYDITQAPCIAGRAALGLGATGVSLSCVSVVLLIIMAAWRQPPAMRSASHVCVILGGVFQMLATVVYVALMTGDIGLGASYRTCQVKPAPLALLSVAAILLWVSSCAMCACCACDCQESEEPSNPPIRLQDPYIVPQQQQPQPQHWSPAHPNHTQPQHPIQHSSFPQQ